MTLHPAIGKNRYCGPGALSILTGYATDETAAVLRDITGKRAIFGIHHRAMLQALARFGMKTYPLPIEPKQFTLGKWIADHEFKAAHAHPDFKSRWYGRYLVCITGHYCVVRFTESGTEVSDNKSIYPRPAAKYRHLRSFIKAAWRIDGEPCRIETAKDRLRDKRKVEAMAKEMGATLRYIDLWQVGVEAPAGNTWIATGTHEAICNDAKDALETMGMGYDSCDEADCEWCADTAAEA